MNYLIYIFGNPIYLANPFPNTYNYESHFKSLALQSCTYGPLYIPLRLSHGRQGQTEQMDSLCSTTPRIPPPT